MECNTKNVISWQQGIISGLSYPLANYWTSVRLPIWLPAPSSVCFPCSYLCVCQLFSLLYVLMLCVRVYLLLYSHITLSPSFFSPWMYINVSMLTYWSIFVLSRHKRNKVEKAVGDGGKGTDNHDEWAALQSNNKQVTDQRWAPGVTAWRRVVTHKQTTWHAGK